MSLSARLKKARLKKKMTQGQLAEAIGIKQQAIQRIEAGKVKSTSYIVQLAKILDITPEWLALGETALTNNSAAMNSSGKSTSSAQIPLLQWDDHKSISLLTATKINVQNYITTPIFENNHHKHFALQIKDNSMTLNQGSEMSFLKKDYIIVDSQREAKHNDYVIATLPDSTQMTFRQLQVENNKLCLVALNPQYNTVPIDATINICGVVILRYSRLP